MKVAKKSLWRSIKASSRTTVTLAGETYRKIEQLRGDQSRSAWIDQLVKDEEERRERERLARALRQQYTAAVVRETLALNKEFPIHEK
jgi:predicted RNA-binding protein YlxR (DUF448 family)